MPRGSGPSAWIVPLRAGTARAPADFPFPSVLASTKLDNIMKTQPFRPCLGLLLIHLLPTTTCPAAVADARTNAAPVNLDTPRDFPSIQSASEWQKRAVEIRQQVLVSCGLWPMPEKTPIKPHIFGKVERD